MESESRYTSIFASRYCRDSPLVLLWSEANKVRTWRQLWTWLAQAEHELGLNVTQEQVRTFSDTFGEVHFVFRSMP